MEWPRHTVLLTSGLFIEKGITGMVGMAASIDAVASDLVVSEFGVFINEALRDAYIDIPFGTPLVKVSAAMEMAESAGVIFDVMDPDLCFEGRDGYRLYGMFKEDVLGIR